MDATNTATAPVTDTKPATAPEAPARKPVKTAGKPQKAQTGAKTAPTAGKPVKAAQAKAKPAVKTAPTKAKTAPAPANGAKDNEVLVIRLVRSLGEKQVPGSSIEKAAEKKGLTKGQARRALAKAWEKDLLAFTKENDENPRSEDIWTLLAAGRKLLN